MNPRRAVAKLTPKVSSLSFAIAGGKQYALLPEDVAYALAHIQDPGAGLLVEVKWAGHERAVWPLFRTLDNAAEHFAACHGWGMVPSVRMEGMVWMALLENEVVRQQGRTKEGKPVYVPGAAKCSWCKGSGAARKTNGVIVPCDSCGSTGNKPWDKQPAHRAEMIGLDMSGYDDWQEKVRRARDRRHCKKAEAEKYVGQYPAIRLWQEVWEDRYRDVRAILVGWEYDALKEVQKRLR